MVTHTSSLSTKDAEAGRSLPVQGQAGLHSGVLLRARVDTHTQHVCYKNVLFVYVWDGLRQGLTVYLRLASNFRCLLD